MHQTHLCGGPLSRVVGAVRCHGAGFDRQRFWSFSVSSLWCAGREPGDQWRRVCRALIVWETLISIANKEQLSFPLHPFAAHCTVIDLLLKLVSCKHASWQRLFHPDQHLTSAMHLSLNTTEVPVCVRVCLCVCVWLCVCGKRTHLKNTTQKRKLQSNSVNS